MNRHERRATAKVAGKYVVKPEHYSKKSTNGLLQVDVVFGPVRNPSGAGEVKDAFREVSAALREFADGIDRVNDEMVTFSGGGNA